MILLKSLLSEFWGRDYNARYMTKVEAAENAVRQVAQQFGETIASYAGGGNNGKAWILQSGKVLKLTTDEAEIATAIWKKSKGQSKHIVGYYDIRRIVNIPEADVEYPDQEAYAIIMDGITPLTSKQQECYEPLYSLYFDERFGDSDFMVDVTDYSSDADFRAFWANLISQRKSVLADMRRADVNTYECHEGNVGFDRKNPNQFRVYDIWRYKTQRSLYDKGITATRTIDYNKLINNKPDSTGIDTPNNPNM